MIEPPPARFMPGATACAVKKCGRRLTAWLLSQNSGVTSSTAWRSSSAALLTSTVMSPCASLAVVDCCAQRLDVAYVGLQEKRPHAELLFDAVGKRRARPVGDVDEGDACALPRKALGQCRADAGSAAGDQHGGVPRDRERPPMSSCTRSCRRPLVPNIVSGKEPVRTSPSCNKCAATNCSARHRHRCAGSAGLVKAPGLRHLLTGNSRRFTLRHPGH